MTEDEMSRDVYTLTDEDGKEEQFELLASCEYGDKEYYALASLDNESDEYVILRVEQENGETILVTIDDDDEFDAVADIFDDEVFSDIDYDGDTSDTGDEG
ncbi:MAG: DUF1292 domain-containing protein [Clostridia bacterium]|nr:DUF1292 domain-containing protein [Clostridia bacterium]